MSIIVGEVIAVSGVRISFEFLKTPIMRLFTTEELSTEVFHFGNT